MRWSVLGVIIGLACGPSVDAPSDAGTGTSAGTGGTSMETASSGEPLAACLPATWHGEPIAQHPSGLIAYAGCEDGFFIEHIGDTVMATVEEIAAITDASELELIGIPTITGFGTGTCCSDPADACVFLIVQAATFDLGALLDYLSVAFPSAADACFGMSVRIEGYSGPRCEEPDPQCIPEPYCVDVPPCCNTNAYDPSAPRAPVGDAELSSGGCVQDGDCVLNHGGRTCTSWTTPTLIGLGECDPTLGAAFCGCVENQCHWFEQG